jgi:hypothetical protein
MSPIGKVSRYILQLDPSTGYLELRDESKRKSIQA